MQRLAGKWRAVVSALTIAACTACLSTPQRPVPEGSQLCEGTLEGKRSPGGAFSAAMLDGQPIVADITGDQRDDLILWGREQVGTAMCSRVWIFFGSSNFTSLKNYDRRIDFATAVHAVTVATVSGDNSDNLDLVVLVQNEAAHLLARFDMRPSVSDPIIAPTVALQGLGTGPFVLFGMYDRLVYVGGMRRYTVDFASPLMAPAERDKLIRGWSDILAESWDRARGGVIAAFKDRIVRTKDKPFQDPDALVLLDPDPLEQFTFARRTDIGSEPNKLYGVGVSSTSTIVRFLLADTTTGFDMTKMSTNFNSFGIAAAAAKFQQGSVATTNTDAAILTKAPQTGQLELSFRSACEN